MQTSIKKGTKTISVPKWEKKNPDGAEYNEF
jgi:hypothetical protein